MPASDAFASEIAALEEGMASGEAQIRGADGKLVIYRGVREIREAIGYFRAQATALSAGPRSRTTYVTFCGR